MRIAVLLFIVISIAMAEQLSVEEQWTSFKSTHNKNYENGDEEASRRAIFEDNLKKIEEHNKKYDAGEVTWKMGINKFTDLTPEEMKKFTGLKKPGLSTVT
ncbi:hypothetical protein JTB14_026116 [Gonioctena quinquepunctata]|nr:hypothetical protein JTB14_026116 [Gonioctena quinquepunctata]